MRSRSSIKKPNIIFILGDDIGYDDIGFQNEETINTPTLNTCIAEQIDLQTDIDNYRLRLRSVPQNRSESNTILEKLHKNTNE